MNFELTTESEEKISIESVPGAVYVLVCSFDTLSILLTKEEALQVAAALVSAAKEVDGE